MCYENQTSLTGETALLMPERIDGVNTRISDGIESELSRLRYQIKRTAAVKKS